MRPRHCFVTALVLFALFFVLAIAPASASPSAIPGEILVKYRTGPMAQRGSVRGLVGGTRVKDFAFIGVEHMKLGKGVSVEQAIERLKNNPLVEYAEPNYEITIGAVPNDTRFSELYGMRNTGQTGGTPDADIDADQAWDVYTGDPNLLVGVIDTGIDYSHPDLAANAWTNPGEIPGNSIDDDNNGYVDDIHGYDFVNNDGDPFDDNGHGSHTSGTIAGRGNNATGVTGVNWQCKVVGIKFLSGSGSGSTEGAIAGIQYAIAIGARLTSNSWGGGGFSQALLDAINAAGAAGQLFIASSGNSGANSDTSPSYPAAYDSPFIISVAATDHNDALASFSNFGLVTVDLAAPGVDILSCSPGGGYELLSGTSMACPHVAGVAALAWGRYPAMTPAQCKALILNHVDPKASLAGKCVTGGRLNALFTIADPDTIPPGVINDLATTNPGSNSIDLTWTATGDDGGTGRAASYDLRYSTAPITAGNYSGATPVPGAPSPQTAGSAESHRVSGLAFSTQYYFAIKALDEYGNTGGLSNVPDGTTLGIPDIVAAPDSFYADLLTGASTDQTLTLSNTAAGTLDFTIPTPVIQSSLQEPKPFLPTGKNVTDARAGDLVVDGAGGPDGFGYRWIDSDEVGGPVFNWVDITGVGTPLGLAGDDAISAAVNLGFNFPFYGGSFGSVRIASNGFLTFTDTSAPYANQALPNSGGVTNMVAPMWDDLNLTGAAAVYTYNDGGRFIIAWVDVPHYSGSGSGTYTFEAILYPSGEIKYQYLSLVGDINSATVGIQNAAETVGLNVAFNTAYLHDNLAVRIFSVPQWLSVTPTSGRIPAGQSINLNLRFDASGLSGGNHLGAVTIASNDPDENPLSLQARLHVIGAPNIVVAPDSASFDSVYIGASPTRSVVVTNSGTDDLHVTGMTSSDATVTVAPVAFTLAPSAAQNVTVTFAPVAVGPVSATIDIASDDPDTPTKTVFVTGTGVTAPNFSVSPDSFHVTLNTNQSDSRNVRITNNGGSNYTFTAEAEADLGPAPQRVQIEHHESELAKGAVDSRTGPVALSSGGPDAFGYTYKDSDEPSGGPAFNWLDIRPVGTQIGALTGDDQNGGPLPIGFSFPFYGSTFTSFRVCTNGWVSFTNGTLTTFTNTGLPNNGATVPENMLAAFWDDLNFNSSPRAYYHSDGTRLVIQFQDVSRFLDSTHPNTFEIILYPNGRIVYQYLSVTATTLNSHTVGIQNAGRDDGLQVAFNTPYAHSNLALEFRPPARFLTVAPSGGSIPPGGFMDLAVGFNASGLLGGEYAGRVRINGNDPIQPEKNVPCLLTVIGVPDVGTNAGALHYGNVYIGYPALRQLQVTNTGSDVLHVSNIATSDPAFGVDVASVDVPPSGSALVNVSFNPALAQGYSGTLTVTSDDPDTPSLIVTLDGSGLSAPDLQLSAGSLQAALATNLGPRALTKTKPVVIHNGGGSDLTWSTASAVGLSASATHPPQDKEADKGAASVPGTPVIAGTGGPDGYGYCWIDSDEAGGPAFSWVEISGVGTPISFIADDENLGIAIPFAFPFYGNSFNSIRACSNGWLSFTNSTLTTYTNTALPNSGTTVPENLIAPWWDDQDLRTSGDVYSYYDGTRFIIEYLASPHYGNTGTYTYQVMLYPNGDIHFQYLDMQGVVNTATVGIQNAARDIGLQVVSDAAYVHNNLRVKFSRVPEWLSVAPDSGVIAAGEDDTLHVTFNATGLADGDYDGVVAVTSNDPTAGNQNIACQLHVGTAVSALDLRPDYSQATTEHGWIEAAMTDPGLQCAPASVSLSSLLATGGIPVAPGSSALINSCNATVDFSRMSLLSALPGGGAISATVSGEIPDVTWFTTSETMRMLRPVLNVPSGPHVGGSTVPLTWTNGAAIGATHFQVWFSPDGGGTWQNVTQNDADHAHSWAVPRTLNTSTGHLELLAYDGAGYMGSVFTGPFSIVNGTTGVEAGEVPDHFALSFAGANPVRGRAQLELAMPRRGTAEVRVYDVRGGLVREIANGEFAPGRHPITWDGTLGNGHAAGSGIYFVQVRSTLGTARLRLAVVK